MKSYIIILATIGAMGCTQAVNAVVSAPQFDQVALTACHNGEAAIVGAVQTGIGLYAANAMVESGSAKLQYPPKLDDAADGPASAGNKFFIRVLEKGVDDPKWSKKGSTYSHTCPDRTKTFTYNSKKGTFE